MHVYFLKRMVIVGNERCVMRGMNIPGRDFHERVQLWGKFSCVGGGGDDDE